MIPLRAYSFSFTATAATGAIDYFELVAGSTVGLVLLSLDISQTTEFGDAQDEMVEWFVKRASGSYTSGSGGATPTGRPMRAGDSAATCTCEARNTTQLLVGSGTLVTVHNSAFNIRAGIDKIWTPETAPSCGISQALVVGMVSAPADSVSWCGTAIVGELTP